MVPQTNIDTRTYRNDFGLDTGSYQNDFDTDTWLYQNGISPATGPDTGGFLTATWLDQGGYGPDTWPYQNGIGPDARNRHAGAVRSGGGRHRPPAKHRKPPSRRMRRAATASAIALAGGGAAVGLLYATGPQPMLTSAAELNAKAVTSVARPGTDGAASAIASAAPSAVGSPVHAYVPKHAVAKGKHAAKAPRTTAPTQGGTPSASHPAPTPTGTQPSPTPTPTHSAPSPKPTPTHSKPAPSPSPTQPPTSSPPTTGGGSGTCTNPTFTTSSDFGQENLGPYTVSNNMWNVGGGGISQTLEACSASSWFVNANVAADGGGVKTYPNSHYNYDNTPEISSLSSVTSTFGQTIPNNGDFEDAYDIWLNGTAGAGGDEVMIWTHNHGEYPAGSPQTTATFDGQSYTVWKGNNGPVSFVSNTNVDSGNLNLLQFFQWLINKGWEPANSRLYQVDYGVEINSTGGGQETFGFDNFSVTTNG
jgi:Glycosyl hydrolase family 12